MTEEEKICKSCRKSVDIKATKCPYCQEDLRTWFRRHPILTLLLLMFFLPIFMTIFSSSIPSRRTSSSNNSQVESTKTPEEVQAEKEQKRLEKEQAQIEQQEALDTYMSLLETSGMSEFLQRAEVQGADMTVVVRNTWHYQPKQIRLQAAQVLWETWVELCPKDDPDLCRITIEDLNGNKVGGSSWLAGSIIDVDD